MADYDDPFAFESELPPPPTTGTTGYKAKNTGKRSKQPNHYERVTRHFESQGFWCFKTEFNTFDPRSQNMRKQDLLGFADMLALQASPYGTRVIAVQVTTKDSVAAHLRKYVNHDTMSGGVKTSVAVRKWLDHNCRFVILGFHQPDGPGGRWEFTTTEVTHELLDKVLARRRG